MRPNKRTLIGSQFQSVYVGTAKTDKLALPKDFAVQRIEIDVRGTLDISVGTTTLVEDAGQRLLKQVKLELTGGKNGSKVVCDVSGVDLYIKNFYDYHRAGERVVPTAVANGSAFSFQLVIDFRLAHNNPDDFSIAIPFYALSSVDLTLDWDSMANGYGSVSTFANVSFTANISLFEGIHESNDEKNAQLKAPLMTILARQFNTSASTGDEIRDTDIVVGNLIRRIFWITRASGGTRSDVEITNFVLGTADTNFINRLSFYASQHEDLMDYRMPNYDGNRIMKGVTILDFARAPVDEAGQIVGLNTLGLKSGDLKFTLNKAVASTISRYIQEQVEA